VGTQAERGAAADCLALRIRENAPSTWRLSTRRKFPVLARSQSKMARIRRVGNPSRVGCGGGLPHIAYSRKCALKVAIFDASNIRCFGALIVESGSCSARGDPSRAGCGGGLPRIAYSRNRALDVPIFDASNIRCLARSPPRAARIWRMGTQAERDAAVDCIALRIREIGPSARRFSCQRVEDSLFWRARRRERRVLGAWRPKPSGMRRRSALHCVFAKMRPRRGDFAPRRRIFSVLALSQSQVARIRREGIQVERDAAVDCLALRIREIGPSTCRFSTRRIFAVLARSPSRAARIWRVGTQAERDAAADCIALRIREIGPSARRFSCQRVEDSLCWRARRRERRVLGAWGPKPSGVRRWTASHCVFAKLGPRLGNIATTPRRFSLLTCSPWRAVCFWCVETGAEWDAATRLSSTACFCFAKSAPRPRSSCRS
jgi:hypothetical protein